MYGNQFLTKTNISYFRTIDRCGYQFDQGQSKSNSTYNSILNNTSTNIICIRNYILTNTRLYKSNIIHNYVKDQVISNFRCFPLTVEECNIFDNLGTYTFYIEESGNAVVNNCYLKNNKKALGNVVFNNIDNYEINFKLNHLSEERCQPDSLVQSNHLFILDEFEDFSLFSLCILLFSRNNEIVFISERDKHEIYNRQSLFGYINFKYFFSFFK